MTLARRTLLKLLASLPLAGAVSIASASEAPQVLLKTSMGDIVLALDQDKAPKTVANFLQYVKNGHYNGTIFHRVIDGFMIQGGGFLPDMSQKATAAPIENEAKNGLKNVRYSIAMARTAAPHSATAQFFINVRDNTALDHPGHDGWGYAVFGRVIKGQDVVDRIKAVPTTNAGMHQNVPAKPVIIESARIVK
ncbi:MAG TPA: peptidylprolyl isomerase [Noviherbaspirillum sp.]|nr:peptidylprolyl isomerase [Noviherbaspirillum sp.]